MAGNVMANNNVVMAGGVITFAGVIVAMICLSASVLYAVMPSNVFGVNPYPIFVLVTVIGVVIIIIGTFIQADTSRDRYN